VAQFSPAGVMKKMNISMPAMQDANALSKLAIDFNLLATTESLFIQNVACRLDDTLIKGSVTIRDFVQPAVNFKVSVDAVDADRYLSPKIKTDKPQASPAVALAAAVSKVPVAVLRKLNADGEIVLAKLKINGLTMCDVHLTLSGKKGIATTQQSINQFYEGYNEGGLSLDLRNDRPVIGACARLQG
jgi:AsmA protein